MRGLLLYPAELLGGVVLMTVVLVAIVFFWYQSIPMPQRHAVAGGWTYLLNTPWVVVLLTLGFGLGFYLGTLIFRRL